jgi:hypothetical protein
MQSLQRSSIEGFNDFLRDQQQESGECALSLCVFNTDFDIRHVAEPIDKIKMLDTLSYQPSGGTALLDAVGSSVKGAEAWLEKQRNKKDWKVIVATLTDGYENSSHEWHISQPPVADDDRDLLGLIRWKTTEGWEFMFLGAGGSQWLEQTFGSVVAKDHFVAYDHSPMAHSGTYAGLSNTVSTTRSTGHFDTSQFQR